MGLAVAHLELQRSVLRRPESLRTVPKILCEVWHGPTVFHLNLALVDVLQYRLWLAVVVQRYFLDGLLFD